MKKFMDSNLKYKLALAIVVFGLIIFVSGTSYAILSGTITSENQQIIRAGDVTLELTEYYEAMSKKISYIEDTDGLLQEDYYSFNLKNIGVVDAKYEIKLLNEAPDDFTGNLLTNEYIRIGIEINGEEYGPFSLEETEQVIDTGVIAKNELLEYKLRIWLDKEKEEELVNMEDYKAFLKLNVTAEQR